MSRQLITGAAFSSHGSHNDLLCFSHLRWNFVYQRPQHLLRRFAQDRRVFFFEEPIFDSNEPRLEVRSDDGVTIAVPHLSTELDSTLSIRSHTQLLDELLTGHHVVDPVLWYYTPMALEISRHLPAAAVVFDCMDELSAFANAPAALLAREQELLECADVVFTGGQSLYEAKRHRHPHVHAFPSSVDVNHFRQARATQADPADQAGIPRPRMGFFGVVDERIDLDLVAGVARLRPEWHQVIIGPVVKIDAASLPRAENIHYLGMKGYEELPRYLAGWDVAILPFARNAATRYISPTKTPEYLAAGRPVVSTSIADVVRPYGEQGFVKIADAPAEFSAALSAALADRNEQWLRRVDEYLSGLSWDRTYAAMNRLVNEAVTRRSVSEKSRHQEVPHEDPGGDSHVRLLDCGGRIRG